MAMVMGSSSCKKLVKGDRAPTMMQQCRCYRELPSSLFPNCKTGSGPSTWKSIAASCKKLPASLGGTSCGRQDVNMDYPGNTEVVINSKLLFGPTHWKPIDAPARVLTTMTGCTPGNPACTGTLTGCTTYSSYSAALVKGKVAVVLRGGCTFVKKVQMAQAAGAVAVIVYNNARTETAVMGGTCSSCKIPSIIINQRQGKALIVTIANNKKHYRATTRPGCSLGCTIISLHCGSSKQNGACSKALANSGHMMGGFRPRCASDGTYVPVQCRGSTGYCWCVNKKTGTRIPGTQKRGRVSCSSTSSPTPAPKGKSCQGHGYIPRQCVSWNDGCNTCSVRHGKKQRCTKRYCFVQGTPYCARCSAGGMSNAMTICANAKCASPCCGGSHIVVKPPSQIKGDCAKALAAIRKTGGSRIMGGYIPKCQTNGNYVQIQCSGSTGYCWCVDPKSGKKTTAAARGRSNCAVVAPPPPPSGSGSGSTTNNGDTNDKSVGQKCATGFCENMADCPRCKAGLTCVKPRGMMCAGKCFGKCAKTTWKGR